MIWWCSGASGGQFIGTDDGSGEDTGVVQMDGIATYPFSVAQEGIYKLIARVGDFGGNSFRSESGIRDQYHRIPRRLGIRGTSTRRMNWDGERLPTMTMVTK